MLNLEISNILVVHSLILAVYNYGKQNFIVNSKSKEPNSTVWTKEGSNR